MDSVIDLKEKANDIINKFSNLLSKDEPYESCLCETLEESLEKTEKRLQDIIEENNITENEFVDMFNSTVKAIQTEKTFKKLEEKNK